MINEISSERRSLARKCWLVLYNQVAEKDDERKETKEERNERGNDSDRRSQMVPERDACKLIVV